MRFVLCLLVLLSTLALAQEQAPQTSTAVAFFAPSDVAYQSAKEMKLPEFPSNAQDHGLVILRFIITPEGSVGAVQDLVGEEPFVSASVAALKQWKFEPFRAKEKKVTQDVASQIGFSFGRLPASLAGKDVRNVDPDASPVRVIFPFGDFSHEREETAAAKSTNIPQKVRISGGLAQSLLVSQAKPIYPAEAKVNHTQGTVVLHALIARDGSIKTLAVVKTVDKSLAMAAIDAVRQWRYKPYTLNGNPVEVDTQIQVNFILAR